MKHHVKLYLDYFGFDTSDFIPCEYCGSRAVDIHHIKSRGMGGSKNLDYIENLIALCRHCHDEAHGENCIEFTNHLKQIILKRHL